MSRRHPSWFLRDRNHPEKPHESCKIEAWFSSKFPALLARWFIWLGNMMVFQLAYAVTHYIFLKFALMSWKLNIKTFLSLSFVRLEQTAQSLRNFTHCFPFGRRFWRSCIVCKDRYKSMLLGLLFFVVRNWGLQTVGPEPSPESHHWLVHCFIWLS